MRRFYITQDDKNKDLTGFEVGQKVSLDPQQSKHAWRVLRLEVGQGVQLVDGSGVLAMGVIEKTKPIMQVLVEQVSVVEPLLPRLTLACAIPKAGRAGEMVNQLCQLGLDELIPLTTTRSVVEPDQAKLDRYQRIMVEASKQCGRTHRMVVSPPMSLQDLEGRDFDEKRIALPAGEAMGEPHSSVKTLLIVIGPEGGFTDEEQAWATEKGYLRWQFGPHILRIETAAVASIAILRSQN